MGRTMKVNLKSLSIAELKALQDEIVLEMEMRSREARQNLLQEFRDKAKAMGVTLEELMSGQKSKGKTRATGRTVAAKYANPADASQTWTGRGKRPRWVSDLLAAGKSLDELKV